MQMHFGISGGVFIGLLKLNYYRHIRNNKNYRLKAKF